MSWMGRVRRCRNWWSFQSQRTSASPKSLGLILYSIPLKVLSIDCIKLRRKIQQERKTARREQAPKSQLFSFLFFLSNKVTDILPVYLCETLDLYHIHALLPRFDIGYM